MKSIASKVIKRNNTVLILIVLTAIVVMSYSTVANASTRIYEGAEESVRVKEVNEVRIEMPEEYIISTSEDEFVKMPEPERIEIPELPIVPVVGLDGGTRYRPALGARPWFFSWMSYRAVTNRNSNQWGLQHNYAYTCTEGFRRVDGIKTVAVGTFYLNRGVGDILHVELDSGLSFYVVVGDVKSDVHTDPTNRFILANGCMLEFIVDVPQISERSRQMGDMTHSGLPGSVVSIRNTGVNIWD